MDRTSGDLPRGARVLVVGGGGRMGLAVARLAATAGGEVTISGRSGGALDGAAGGELGTRVADFSVPEEAERLVRELSPLDHLVVAASGGGAAGSIPGTPPEAARAAFSRFWISYNALHLAPHAVREGGSVTLISGSSGRRPMAGVGVWGALHGSIEALARSAALEIAPIRVNVISPGGVAMRPDRQLARHAGQPEDVAAMVLAAMANPHVTGATIDVDGGERLGTWPGR